MDAGKLHDAIAAACPIVGITIGRDDDRSTWSIDFAPAASDAQKAAAEAVLQAYDPEAKTQFSYLEFEALFTAAEQAAILTAAQGNVTLFQWLLRSAGASVIDVTLPETKAGLDALAAAGLITAARETAILAGLAPPA